MKTALACVVCGMIAFLIMQVSLTGDVLDGSSGSAQGGSQQPAGATENAAKFPEELATVVRGQPAPKATAWKRDPEKAPAMVILRDSGELHPWHEKLEQEWRSDSVEHTELVLVLSKQYRSVLSVTHYPHLRGAPPIKRYRHEMNAWLVEARTGGTLASRRFVRDARPVRKVETWDTTELGDPIIWGMVIGWVREQVSAAAKKQVASATE